MSINKVNESLSPTGRIPRQCQWRAFILPVLILFIVSCSEDEDLPEPETVLTPINDHTSIDEATGVVYVEDLPGSVGNTFASGHIPVFYSFEDHQIINPYSEDGELLELSEEERLGTAWDIAFISIYNSYITSNNSSIENNPAYGGEGSGSMIVLDALFDELDEAPTDEAFEAFMETQSSAGWEDFPPGDKGWYFYSLDSHIMSAIAGITIVIKTPDDKYAKIEMSSLYLNSPENPTVNTPAPYFTFRYFLQPNGSKNLRTR
ncbi:MAG: HmuY family protein [Bacteroidota bacterium]